MNNIMQNVQSIELGALVVDSATPTNCIMIQTLRNRYCFRLSESFPLEKQYEMFKQFVIDVNTPMEKPNTVIQPTQQEEETTVPTTDVDIPSQREETKGE